mgnify:CR=1 FL=1
MIGLVARQISDMTVVPDDMQMVGMGFSDTPRRSLVSAPGFRDISNRFGSTRAKGWELLDRCEQEESSCHRKAAKKPQCRVHGHFFDTMYQNRLNHLRDESFQALEIGFFNGNGYNGLAEFFYKAELHAIDISCLPHGARSEGKWPYENFAEKSLNLFDR